MSILDSSAAVSEAPSAPLDGIESQAEGAAEHLPNGSPEAAPEHLFAGNSRRTLPRRFGRNSFRTPPRRSSGSFALSCLAKFGIVRFRRWRRSAGGRTGFGTSTEQSAQKQRGRPFKPGQSGNPNGRPKGARNVVTRAVEALIDGQGEALGAKAIEKALQGDSPMLRALLKMLVPPRRERTVEFELPKIESAADVLKASSAVITACADGELTPHEAN